MLPDAFFNLPTLALARALLGKRLVRRWGSHTLIGRIVEVEAYHQDGDRAAHSHGGKTPRNEVMFGPPGHVYVYFIYGMHYCMNVVTEPEGIGAAVLIRAVEPLQGVEIMQQLRGPRIRMRDLTNGPAKCCEAFDVGPSENGLSLNGPDLFLDEGEPLAKTEIAAGHRIGITKSTDLEWRFFINNNRFVSKGPVAGSRIVS